MKDDIKEAISALSDDEQDRKGASHTLDRIMEDPELRAIWGRYHLLGDLIRHRVTDDVQPDLLARVRRSIEAEPIPLARRRRSIQFLKPAAGLALAASVAALAILGVRSLERDLPGQSPLEVAGNRWDVNQPAVEARLNAYLVNHSEYLGHGMHGMLPYARIVGYDTTQ